MKKHKSSLIIVLVFLGIWSTSKASGSLLTQVKKLPVSSSTMPGYEFDTDQAFQINSGPLSNHFLFFAMKALGGEEDVIPRFVVANKSSIIDSLELPTVKNGWNIVAVQAVTAEKSKDDHKALRILALLTLEPISQRESDYWDQAFVFDISQDGKIDANKPINSKLYESRKKLKTLKELKKYLRSLGI